MTEWPEDGSPALFENLSTPIVSAIRFAYHLERQNQHKNIAWNGPPWTTLYPVVKTEERLKAGILTQLWHKNNKTALDEIIRLAIQLGIEQGERLFKQTTEYKDLKNFHDTVKTLLEEERPL